MPSHIVQKSQRFFLQSISTYPFLTIHIEIQRPHFNVEHQITKNNTKHTYIPHFYWFMKICEITSFSYVIDYLFCSLQLILAKQPSAAPFSPYVHMLHSFSLKSNNQGEVVKLTKC